MAKDVPTIAAALSTILTNAGVRGLAYLKDNPNPPCALVGIGAIDYHMDAANSQAAHNFTIYLIVSRSSDRAGYAEMEKYVSNTGTKSIRRIIESDTSQFGAAGALGPPTADVVVKRSHEPRSISINGNPYIGVTFEVTVYA